MRFLNRHKELNLLKSTSKPAKSFFVVLYGRRRIGKTRLLLEWNQQSQGLYYVADESNPVIQRRYFAEALGQKIPGFDAVEYPNWSALWDRLAREIKTNGWHGPLIIDEFPYLVSSSPELPSILQRFIDHVLNSLSFALAIAGSSQRMMQGLILDHNAPLYGRATQVIDLQPLSIAYLPSALNLSNPIDVVRAYTLWGGIPRYWELAAALSGETVESAAEKLVLDPMGPLHNEPMRLLLEESPPAISLRPILDIIGSGVHRPSEIAGRLGVPVTSLTTPLGRLRELGLVIREVPFGENEKISKRALYKIADPFFRLWFKVVAPKRGWLAETTTEKRLAWLREALETLEAQCWEEICRKAVTQIGNWDSSGRFWHKNTPEWDIVAINSNNTSALLGECKWSRKPPTVREIDQWTQELLGRPRNHIPILIGKEPIYTLFISQLPADYAPSKYIQVITAGQILNSISHS